MNFYNDIDPFCCDWLRALVDAGELPAGHVEQRSVLDVEPKDLTGFTQCHWFCGIGGWPLALRMAGWRSDAPVWTASLPCQPLSCAGKRAGDADERHLWPGFFRLVRECSPAIIFGEQVASKDGLEWLDGVFADLEDAHYACGAADLCAAGQGAPHIRQRLYWCAVRELGDSDGARWQARGANGCQRGEAGESLFAEGGQVDGLAVAEGAGGRQNAGAIRRGATEGIRDQEGQDERRTIKQAGRIVDCSSVDGMGVPNGPGSQPWSESATGNGYGNPVVATGSGTGRVANAECDGGRSNEPQRGPEGRTVDGWLSPWSAYHLVNCRDGRTRRISAQSGDEPLAARLPRSVGPGGTREQRMELLAAKANRVGRLKGYGNAICPQVAAKFIKAFMEMCDGK